MDDDDGTETGVRGMTDGAAIAAGLMLLAVNHFSAIYLQSALLPVVLMGCAAIVGGIGGIGCRRLLHQGEKRGVSLKRRFVTQQLATVGLHAMFAIAGLVLGFWIWSAVYR